MTESVALSGFDGFPSGWYAILHISEMPKNKPYGCIRFGLPIVIWKDGDEVIVMEDHCPHRSAKLSLGKICDNKIRCPFHGFEFSKEGNCTLAPEFNKAIPKLTVKKYPTKIALDMIWVMFGTHTSTHDISPLEDLFTKFKGQYSFFKKAWNSHITRCIENQLDYTHLPEVHKTTIGRNFVMPQNPRFEQTGNTIFTYQRDNINSPSSIYIFPNSWILNISDKMKIIAYFVPVSQNQTIIYIFTFRSFLTAKPIKPIIDFVMNVSNKIILKQDQKVVESQTSWNNMLEDEVLMKHDKAIKLFRNMWKSR